MDRVRDDKVRDGEPGGEQLREPEADSVQMPRASGTDARRRQGNDIAAFRGGIHWGPIWAGVLVAIATLLLLDLLAIGIGLLPVAGSGAAIAVSAIIGLIAFFIGGYIAGLASGGYVADLTSGAGGRSSGIRYAGPGLLHGLLVWALGTVLILAISVLVPGLLFGALGEVVAGGSALGAFFVLLLSALTAALGGWLGKTSSR